MTMLPGDGPIGSDDDRPARWRLAERAARAIRMPRHRAALSVAIVAAVSLAPGPALGSVPGRTAAARDWLTYLGGITRTGFNPGESVITASSAESLRQLWMATAGGAVSAEPVVADQVIYWGSWDGYEHATTSRGALLWSAFLGTTSGARCNPSAAGVASTATIASVRTGRTLGPAVFVGGGDGYFYALNARTGAVIWKTLLGAAPGGFLWSSPAYYDGSIYEGMASFGDCPLVRGELVRLNAATGAVQDIFYTAPAGCTGAGVWGSPAIDAGTGEVYFATGNVRSCALPAPMATAVVEVTASALALAGYWQVPPAEHGVDSDFGSTPTLFTAASGGGARPLVGVQNKNGVYYALDRADIAAGPVWQRRIANPGECPECGRGDISPSAWDGHRLYVGGGNAIVNGIKCRGTLRAVSPVTGKMIWLRCLPYGAVIGAVTAVSGVVFAGTGHRLLAVSAQTGRTLYQYKDTTAGSHFWGAASISGRVLYAGNQDGHLYAFSP